MTAPTMTIALTGTEAVTSGWQVYRRSQQIPFPKTGAGDLIRAQSRLWHHVEPFTRTDDRNLFHKPDADAIDDAIDALVASVEWHCGTDAAAFVSGTEGESSERDDQHPDHQGG